MLGHNSRILFLRSLTQFGVNTLEMKTYLSLLDFQAMPLTNVTQYPEINIRLVRIAIHPPFSVNSQGITEVLVVLKATGVTQGRTTGREYAILSITKPLAGLFRKLKLKFDR